MIPFTITHAARAHHLSSDDDGVQLEDARLLHTAPQRLSRAADSSTVCSALYQLTGHRPTTVLPQRCKSYLHGGWQAEARR
jgi:hypothetical protein